MERAREGRKGRARTEKGRGKDRSIGMVVRRQVKPSWADDPVQIQDRRWWRGRGGKIGLPPRKDIGRQEEWEERVKTKYVTISDGA